MQKLFKRSFEGNADLRRFAILAFIFWVTFSAYYPFQVVYLYSKGFDNTAIGALISMNSLIVVVAQPTWGMICDKIGSIKKVFIFCLIAATLLLVTLPLHTSTFSIILAFAALTFFECPLPPLLDSWLIRGVKEIGSSTFGHVRLWGSIGFTLMAYVNGKLIDSLGLVVMFVSFFVFVVFTIFACISIRPTSSLPASVTEEAKKKKLSVGTLLKNPNYVLFLFLATLLIIPHRSSYIFLPKLIDSLGANNGYLGLASSVVALSEIPIFIFSGYLLGRFKPVYLILLSTIFFTLRQFLFSLATLPIHVVLIQLLHGPSFALFFTGSLYYIDSLTPRELKSTAQTLGSAMFVGVSGIIGSYGGGWLIDHYGLTIIYEAGTFICLGVSVIFILAFLSGRLTGQIEEE